jgi:hypothetical protein
MQTFAVFEIHFLVVVFFFEQKWNDTSQSICIFNLRENFSTITIFKILSSILKLQFHTVPPAHPTHYINL